MNLFQHFRDFYYPHAQFLGRVTSLTRLENDSKLLLWTILLIASRNHQTLCHLREGIQAAHARLFGTKFQEAVQNPLDLQALLLLCTWPDSFGSQWQDPSAMYLGTAISCARQIGLDKPGDEVFFGTRRATNQLSRYPAWLLKLTWLRCFELDIQSSIWHGHLPILAATRYFRSVKEICQDPNISGELAIIVDVHVQTARYLLLLDGDTIYSALLESRNDFHARSCRHQGEPGADMVEPDRIGLQRGGDAHMHDVFHED